MSLDRLAIERSRAVSMSRDVTLQCGSSAATLNTPEYTPMRVNTNSVNTTIAAVFKIFMRHLLAELSAENRNEPLARPRLGSVRLDQLRDSMIRPCAGLKPRCRAP